MSKDRQTPCKHYEYEGQCAKGRTAEHTGYCQKCDKYEPRAKVKHLNIKKDKLNKIKQTEME
jgi:hypothetical protein